MKPIFLARTGAALLAAAGSLTAFAAAQRAAIPPLEIPRGVGVNIHFRGGHEKELDMIAAGGFRFIRMDFTWSAIERARGAYDWSAYEALTSGLERRGLSAIYILDYSNPLYEKIVETRDPITGRATRALASPRGPESVAAFARWAGAAAARFRGRPVIWEIWNEPNIHFWKPKPNVEDYARLAKAAAKAIRAADPQALIVAPASSGFPWEFLERFFQSGILADLDAVSVHPYRNYRLGPETAAADYAKLRALIRKYAPAGKERLPILSGEWGYATHRPGGLSRARQAAFFARQQLANLASGVPISIWYDWRDDGPDPKEREHNFGVVDLRLQPKPAYLAAQTLARELGGFRFLRRIAAGPKDAWVLLFENGKGARKLAAWSAGSPLLLSIPIEELGVEPVGGCDSYGKPFSLRVRRGKLRLSLGEAPCYIAGRSRRAGR